ncbi:MULTISPECIES: hypothetical protein [Sphingomonas]|uniref:Uncharacterized protein n=1 Tax=Sphingomonas trueperi TaxID=53317 RepID=A0A7X6BCD7_9SPHN|nr:MULTISPECIES: hypothetical protein [Sphingomonas]NJB97110.1 hypothetical protein [Sphingomonas trueperi]
MQALPAPVSQQCVKADDPAADNVHLYVVVEGRPETIEAWLKEDRPNSDFAVESDATKNGVRSVRLLANRTAPYRELGRLIYSGQKRGLPLKIQTVPSICEAKED